MAATQPPQPPSQTLWVDDLHDRETVLNRPSRYGAYLANRARMFPKDDGPPEWHFKAEFAQAAFTIACAPIMTPGYVRSHPRVRDIDWYWDNDNQPAVELALATPPPAGTERLLRGRRWQGWRTYHVGGHRHWVEPDENDRAAAFTVLRLRIPIDPQALPTPAYQDAPGRISVLRIPVLEVAQAAVREVCAQVNALIDPVLAALADGGRR